MAQHGTVKFDIDHDGILRLREKLEKLGEALYEKKVQMDGAGMTRAEYVKFMDEHYASITEINRTKGHDYAGDEDALSNFKTGAERMGLTALQVWGVYAFKHWSAIETFIREGDVKSEPIEGRIHDVILYCFLLLALIEDATPEDSSPPQFDPAYQRRNLTTDDLSSSV